VVDLKDALRPLIDRPPAAPEPLEVLGARARQRRRRRRVSFTAALASGLAVVVTVGVMWSGRDEPKRIETVGPGEVESRIEPGEAGRTPNPPVVVAAGEIDGHPWQLQVHESDAGLCVDLLGGGRACFDVSRRHAVGVAVDATVAGDSTGTARPRLAAVYGPVSRDAARIAIRLASGKVVETSPVGQDAGFAVNFYVYVAQAPTDLPPGDELNEVIAYDANGNELDRLAPVGPLPDLAGDADRAGVLKIHINAVDPCG
jgi:hypothetical protein